MLTVPCATGSLAWEGLMGSLGRTVAGTPWNQNNTEWQNLQDCSGSRWDCSSGYPPLRDVLNDRAPPSIFCFTPLFSVWPSPSHCRCQKGSVAKLPGLCTNWPKLLSHLEYLRDTCIVWYVNSRDSVVQIFNSLAIFTSLRRRKRPWIPSGDQSFQSSEHTLALLSGKAVKSPAMWLGFLHYTL